ncbi:YHYH protein [Spirosoma telluris]|uniref:YHYH protein n=1 Tax=Spirosoma telluris TaxID=2183553 RepID=UPI002FC3B0CD
MYGRKDKDGTYPSNLDAYNGHTAATTEFPDGIYHYHTRNENYLNTGYYILKSGSYYGTKGTFTQ